jgi:hypothetical protein
MLQGLFASEIRAMGGRKVFGVCVRACVRPGRRNGLSLSQALLRFPCKKLLE